MSLLYIYLFFAIVWSCLFWFYFLSVSLPMTLSLSSVRPLWRLDFWKASKDCGESNGTPLQHSCLENPMDGGAWWWCSYKYTCIYSEKAMAPHSSTLACKIPWTEEPGRLKSIGLLRVGHDWATSLSLFTFMHWRRKWQPTSVFLPGESQGQGSLVGCCLWGRTE